MADGRVARLDGIDSGGAEGTSAPVARFGELLGAGATPERVDGSPVPAAPADLRQVGGSAPAAPLADLAVPAPDGAERPGGGGLDQGHAGSGAPGPVALFDSPSLGAGRDDVAVAELGHGTLDRRTNRGGRRRTRGGDAERGGSRRAVGTQGHAPERGDDRATGENPGVRGRRGREPEELDADADPVAVARELCLRLLTDRARTRQELAQALRRKGVPDDAAHTVLERFDEVGLIDDAAFAGQWVRSRHAHRGLARRAIAMELRRKGVSNEDAGEALAEVDAESEERRARELVDRKLRSLAVGTAEQRAAAGRRLVGMLARKGYGAGIAYRVVKEALAERGAEADELGDGEIPDD
jgi:regulatory protein